MKIKLATILLWIIADFIGAFAHEGDILRDCKKNGFVNGWRGDFECKLK